MADLTFYDGLILGAILLTAVFVTFFVALFLFPALWIPLLCGWPVIMLLAFLYLPVKEALLDVLRGPGVYYPQFGWRVRQPPPTFCRQCGTSLEYASRYRRGYCPKCREYR